MAPEYAASELREQVDPVGWYSAWRFGHTVAVAHLSVSVEPALNLTTDKANR